MQHSMEYADYGRSYALVNSGGTWEMSVPSSQFTYEPKAVLKKEKKNEVIRKKKRQHRTKK